MILLPGNYPSATISLLGTASRPIRIDAEQPIVVSNHQLIGSGRTVFKNTELKIVNSAYLRVRGIAFATEASAYASGIEVLSGHHLAFSRNYFLQNTNFGLLFYGKNETDIEQVLVEDNVFRNKLLVSEAGGIGKVRTDYGLRIHGTRTLVARKNLFDGYFNHAISLKEKARNLLVDENVFRICGYLCIDVGQEPDTKAGGTYVDRTVGNVIISDNLFSGSNSPTAILARNVDRLFIDRNSFARFTHVLRIANNNQNSRSCERQLAVLGRTLLSCERNSRLTLTGRKILGIRFARNQITGDSRIVLGGRGYSKDFLSIAGSGTSGKVSISFRTFSLGSGVWNEWTDNLPATLAAPRLHLSNSPNYVAR
ncbi:MAG TPA: right-handed parallel beta-helix repeat-containing protein [Geminicoccus sp.]|nr:right-handed parallel beta-helix repeat-containing protein [Geminicoccus sp.]